MQQHYMIKGTEYTMQKQMKGLHLTIGWSIHCNLSSGYFHLDLEELTHEAG